MKKLLWILLILPCNFIFNSESKPLLSSPRSSTSSVKTTPDYSCTHAQRNRAVVGDNLTDNNETFSRSSSGHDTKSPNNVDTAPCPTNDATFALPMRPYHPEDDERSNHSIDRNPPQNNTTRNIGIIGTFLLGSLGVGSLLQALSK